MVTKLKNYYHPIVIREFDIEPLPQHKKLEF